MNIKDIVQPYTMASPERIDLLIRLAEDTIKRGTPGVMMECGVCNGGSAAILAHYGVPAGKDVHLFDSWEGLPQCGPNDLESANGNTAQSEVGKCLGSISKVDEVIEKVGAHKGPGLVYYHKGWFQDTFPQASSINQIAMLNLDSDWFDSEKLCLETWYDKVNLGGYIYFDDFYYWPGCQKAVLEFLETTTQPRFFNNHTNPFSDGIIYGQPIPKFNKVGHSMWLQKGII